MYNICRECRPGMQECVITYLHRQSTTGIAEKKFKHKCPKVGIGKLAEKPNRGLGVGTKNVGLCGK